jgi:hypothetical protein
VGKDFKPNPDPYEDGDDNHNPSYHYTSNNTYNRYSGNPNYNNGGKNNDIA